MLLLSIRTAVRAILRQRGFAALNILGLAVGLATCLIIFTLVAAELQWDRSLDPTHQLFRLNQTLAFPNTEVQQIANTCTAFGPVMAERVPEVLEYVRIWGTHSVNITREHNAPYVLDQIFFADSTFFTLFNYPLLAGTRDQVLTSRDGIVLREDIAAALFSDGDWIGREIPLDDTTTVRVSGVYRVPDPGSFFEGKAILPIHAYNFDLMNWQNHNGTTFLRLVEHADPTAVAAAAMSAMPERTDQDVVSLWLQPFHDLHLRSAHVSNQLNQHPGDYRMVLGFALIALLILVLASINYINLSTAAAIPRSHEISLRKVLGASRTSLVLQGLGESIGLAFIAMVFAIIFCELAQPWISTLSGREFTAFSLHPVQLSILIGLPLVAGVGGGLYPALLLSSFHPVSVMKRDTQLTSNRGWLRRGLVTFQFVLSTALIILTVALYAQMEAIRKAELGFNTDSIIIVENNQRELAPKMELLAERIQTHASVQLAGLSHSIPGAGNWEITVTPEGPIDTTITHVMAIDPATADIYDLALVDGRWFDATTYPSDWFDVENQTGAGIVVNQRFVEMAGWDDPVGKTVNFWDMTHTVVGVVKNFHHRNLYHPYHPMLIYSGPNMNRFLNVRAAPGQSAAVLSVLQSEWNKLAGDAPLNYHFAEDMHRVQYQAELTAAVYLRLFSALAVVIASLGLLGLTAISATNRIREISIRKVLGARSLQILHMLNREFLIMVLIANAIAWPVAWLLLRSWLDRFAIELPFPVWVFPISSAAILLIALLTTSAQGVRFTRIHPARTLRHE